MEGYAEFLGQVDPRWFQRLNPSSTGYRSFQKSSGAVTVADRDGEVTQLVQGDRHVALVAGVGGFPPGQHHSTLRLRVGRWRPAALSVTSHLRWLPFIDASRKPSRQEPDPHTNVHYPDSMPPQPLAGKSFGLYTPGLVWRDPDAAKNLLLLFDGLALVAPAEYQERILRRHEWFTAGLDRHGALLMIDPADIFDDDTASAFISHIDDITGNSDLLAALKRAPAYRSITIDSRFTGTLGKTVGDLVFEDLHGKGLASSPRVVGEYMRMGGMYFQEASVPVILYGLVMTMWTGVVRDYAARLGADFSPVTDDAYDHDYPTVVLGPLGHLIQENRQILRPFGSGAGNPQLAQLFVGDIHRFGIDLSAAPIEDIIGFRHAHSQLLDTYLAGLTETALLASAAKSHAEQEHVIRQRSTNLADQAAEIQNRARRDFAILTTELGVAVSAIVTSAIADNPLAILLGGVTAAATAAKLSLPTQASQYRYLLVAKERFRYRPWN